MVLRVRRTAHPEGAPAVPPPGADAPSRSQNEQTTLAGDNRKVQAENRGPLTRYAVDIIIAARGLQLNANPDGSRHGSVKAALVAYDDDGHPLNWMEREVPLDMDAKRFAAIQETGVNFRLELDIPKDGASLRTGVIDINSGHTGTLEVPLAQVSGIVQNASQSK
jgi:hypothetical protein